MFSDRWNLLKNTLDGCTFASPDRFLSHAQFSNLFHAFALQVRENEGTVYIIQNKKPLSSSRQLASHLADALTYRLNITSHELTSDKDDLLLHLSLLLKKTDLIITLDQTCFSIDTQAALSLAKIHDAPMITLSGQPSSSEKLSPLGDLSAMFNLSDETLVETAQYVLLESLIYSWPYDLIPSISAKQFSFVQPQPQPPFTRLRI
jgi:hypothetical protein